MPCLAWISRRLHRAIFEFRHADLSYLEGEDGPSWRDVQVKARLLARLSAAEWENFFSCLEDMLIFTPGDLKSIPLSEPRAVAPGALECCPCLAPASRPVGEHPPILWRSPKS